MSPNAPELDEFAVAYLRESGVTTGKQLYRVLTEKFPQLTEDSFADLIQRLTRRGQVDVYDEQKQADSLQDYLAAYERSLWFYVSIMASVSAALSAYLILPNSPFLLLRWALGLVFVLVLPGYVAVGAFFPTAEFTVFDRLALSVGVSLVLAMFSGFALNYTPWGIRLVPILLLLSGETICLATVAIVRQFEASRRGSRRIIISQEFPH